MKLYPVLSAYAVLALTLSACIDGPQDSRPRAQLTDGVSGAALWSPIGLGSGPAVGASVVLGTMAGARVADGD